MLDNRGMRLAPFLTDATPEGEVQDEENDLTIGSAIIAS